MTDRQAALETALEQVIDAARAHLAAVRNAAGAVDDDEVWRCYVAVNNASHDYDELLLDAFGEVTPWETQAIDPDLDDRFLTDGDVITGGQATDPHPAVISVRQRRDYRVPSVSALIRSATVAARRADGGEDIPPPETVAEALLELVQAGDGSLGSLDVPELEPLDGLVTVLEVAQPLDADAYPPEDGASPFQIGAEDRLVGRLDEHPYLDLDEEVESHGGR